MDIREKIKAGEYAPSIAYPTKPAMPEVLNRKASQLTTDQIETLAEVRNKYLAELEKYNADRAEYRKQEQEGVRKFQADLEEDCGIPSNHPKAETLFTLAWEYGHSDGLMSVVYYYEEFSELLTV